MKRLTVCSLFLLLVGAAGCNDPTSTQAQISWNADLGEQQGFLIEQSTDNVNFTQVASVANGTNTATVTGLSTGHTYYFRVRAYNQSGDSPYSPVVSVVR